MSSAVIRAPEFQYYKAVQNIATIDGTVLIGPVRCVNYDVFVNSPVGYDGNVGVEVQKLDGTWLDFISTNTAGAVSCLPGSDIEYNSGTATNKYPFVIRVVSRTHPTTVDGTLVYAIIQTAPGSW